MVWDYVLVLWAGSTGMRRARVLRAAYCTFTVSCMIAVYRHVFEREVYVDFLCASIGPSGLLSSEWR